MSRRNTRIFNIAHVALYRTTYRVADGIDQLEAERVRAVSGPDKGDTAGRSTDPTSTTERNGTEAARLDLLIADLRDAIDGFDIAHKHLLQLADQACRTRAFARPVPEEEILEDARVPECRDSQYGLAGVEEWGSYDEDGNPTCRRAPVKAGLCNQHYQAWYRYRVESGIDVRREFEPGAA